LQFLRDQEKHFEGFTVKNISKNGNSDADELAKAAAQNTSLPQETSIHQSSASYTQRSPYNTK
jgi:hypothetical protein